MRTRWACAFVALVGCSGRSETGGADASAAAPIVTPQTPLGAFGVFDAHLHAPGVLTARGDHLRLEGTPVALDVAIPRVSTGALHVAVAAAALDIEPLDASPVAARVDGTTASYAGISASTDAFFLLEPARVEEVRLLRDANAPTTFRYRITRARGVERLRLREGILEALDSEGRARLRMDRPFAVDARGVRRDLVASLTNDVLTLSLDATGLAHPIAVDPSWGPTTSMNVSRRSHAVLKLSSGKVLVAGGDPAKGFVTSIAEIYDGATRTWTLASSMSAARSDFGLVQAGTKAIAIGGRAASASTAYSTVEIYDPATDTWTAAKSMGSARWNLGAIAVPSGRIVVAGGNDGTKDLSTGSVYDPTKDTWTDSANAMPYGRSGGSLVRVGTGNKVLYVGNVANVNDTSAVVFDPLVGLFTSVASMSYAHGSGPAVTLPDGRAMVIGGAGNGGAAYGCTGLSEIYDPSSDSWKSTPGMASAGGGCHVFGKAIVGVDGNVLVVGGQNNVYAAPDATTTDLYDPLANTWKVGPAISRSRTFGGLAVLPDGSTIFVGGDTAMRPFFDTTTSPTAQVDALAESLPKGNKCSADGACVTGSCSQTYCCDRPCTGACESCDVPGKEGTCTVLTGSVGTGKAVCTGSGTCAGTCDGSSPTCTFPTLECVTASCTGGVATPQSLCDGKGACPTKTVTYCGDYACGAVTCKTACSADTDCVTGRVCDVATSKCVTKKARGAACTKSTECTSGFCADGLCCDKACNGACEACDVAASEGVCTALDGVADKHGKCGTGPCADVCKSGACAYKASTVACGAACVGSMLNTAGDCSGIDDECAGAGSSACPGNYACEDATKCRTKCFVNSDCAAGFVCDIFGSCIAPPDAGTPDTSVDTGTTMEDSAPVDTGTVDTSTPDTAVAESGTRLPDDPKITGDFQRCTKDSECSTGHCVEGVCCDTACTDRCHSCALLSAPGKCTVEPIGVDLKNECGPALSCLGTCDGTGQCIGSGTGTMCARNKCITGSKGVGPAYCAAPGAACNDDEAIEFDCMPYACEPAFGACLSQCKTSDDCANGFVCDVGSRTCVQPTSPEADSGCAFDTRGGRTSTNGMAGIALVLAAFRLARRRVR